MSESKVTRAVRKLVLPLCLAAAGCYASIDAPDPSGAVGAASGWNAEALPERFGYGREATDAEITALDIDISPDGTGLPPGNGTPDRGAELYAAQCALCHGPAGEGTPAGNRLVGVEPIDSVGWNRTIGNYWPYATSVFDYIRRAMPFDRPGSLADAEVYALTAYLLHLNGIISEDAVLDAEALPKVVMPARDRFVLDDREESTTVR